MAGNLHLAASTYGAASGDRDYFAGPLTDVGTTSEEDCNNFDRIWSTTSEDIEIHIADWNDNGAIDGPIPESILTWPGVGNPEFESFFSFELPNPVQGLAPFIDLNGNGVYEPNSGDYPNINGADQGHWTVFNDAGNIHTESGGDILRMEIHLLAYAYESSESAINNATFYDYTFINKAVDIIDSTIVGIWVDPDLGCFEDDFVGCSPDDDMAYVYNQDALDGDANCACMGGVNTYCDEIPVVGIKILKGIAAERNFNEDGDLIPASFNTVDTIIEEKMTSFMLIGGGGISQGQDPVQGYYRLLTGTWPDGTPLTTGGDGYNPGSTDYTKFAYPGNPAVDTSWSMCNSGTTGGDYRMLMGIGPFRMLPGQVKTMSFAVIAALDVAHPCPDMSVLQGVGNEVCDFYDNNFNVGINTPLYNNSNLTLSPNPFSNQTQLTLEGTSALDQVQLYSITGQLLRNYSGLSANSLRIEKGSLGAGMYIYKATSTDGKNYSGKIVIN